MFSDKECYTQLPAEDLVRAKNFYADNLCLKVVMDESPHMVLLEAGNKTKIFIYKREKTKADHTVLGFFTEDVQGTAKKLNENGIELERYEGLTDENGFASRGEMKIAWFKDTEGNIICINSPFAK